MPNEMYLALDQLWADLLLTVGLVLVLGSVVAIALCALGGCLDFLARRRLAKNQQRQRARSQQQGGRERDASVPAPQMALVEARPAMDDDGLSEDIIHISEMDEYSSPINSGLIVQHLTVDAGKRERPPLSR
jgi:hypothetical protein